MSGAVERLGELAFLPRDEHGPTFSEAWQAEAFATALALLDAGMFSWGEWSDALGAAITAAQRAGDPDLGNTYYEHCLVALEGLCRSKGALSAAQVDERQHQWRAAYERTPHGQPVELTAGLG